MKIQRGAGTVLERTSHYLKVGVLRQKPAWFDIVGAHPPHVDLTKKAKVIETQAQKQDPSQSLFHRDDISGIHKTRSSAQDRSQKNNSISRIPKLEFLEDQLRDVFYHQHPWEFSRPKTLIESSGEDNKKCNWSTMLQFNKPLDGESVVQRTIWLLEESKTKGEELTLFEAYDMSRFEFYRLRMQEEMNSTVSKEESSMYGAVYPSTHMEWGLKQEQTHIDSWAKIASERTLRAQASMGKGNVVTDIHEIKQDEESIWESSFEISETVEKVEKAETK
jgi:small subunit ribosomal protein S23